MKPVDIVFKDCVWSVCDAFTGSILFRDSNRERCVDWCIDNWCASVFANNCK